MTEIEKIAGSPTNTAKPKMNGQRVRIIQKEIGKTTKAPMLLSETNANGKYVAQMLRPDKHTVVNQKRNHRKQDAGQ